MEKLLSSLGRGCVIIGAQWGDEGKGKAIDLLAEHFDVIARASGGANAGHTIVVNGKKRVFHLVPSGALHEGKSIVMGAGMVIHLPTLVEEVLTLKEAGIDILPRLSISHEAHVIFEFHKDIDAVLEERRAKVKGQGIGTTKRGIGPAYMDKAQRTGIRMGQLSGDLRKELEERRAGLKEMYGITLDIERELSQVEQAWTMLHDCVCDVVPVLSEAKSLLIEGAQGSLLDIDHGTYPYVTSSATTSAGALQGLGLPPTIVKSCVGIAKAYCTRVGSGDFPAEVEGEVGERIRKRGGEYGATTGRPRRCGWLSIPDLRRAAFINGVTHWNITKLDVLDEEETIPVVAENRSDGSVRFENLPGWNTATVGIREFSALPKAAQDYLTYIERETNIPASLIGTGPDRHDMIIRS